jgi:hypothetical protein
MTPPAPPSRPARRFASAGLRRIGVSLALLTLPMLLVAPTCGRLAEDGWVNPLWLQVRQNDYLRFVTEQPLSPSSVSNVIAHLEREQRDARFTVAAGAVPDDAWDGIFLKMWRLRDTSDFDALRFINLIHGYRGHPAIRAALWQRVEQALLEFKYWYTDPTPERSFAEEPVVDMMWYWTENHILIFHVVEYLAGQHFPDRVFAVSGLTGREHMERVRPRILRWLDERARFGFTEWHSNVYYNLDLQPLLTLVEWAEDPVLAQRASMVLDLLLLDTALHLHRGTFGATHGRSYIKDKAAAEREDTFGWSKLLFDDTALPYPSRGDSGAVAMARARKYRLPEVIRRIARHDAPMIDRQRMNLPLDEAPPQDLVNTPPPVAPFGLDYRNEANLPFWWSMGAQPVWMNLPLTLEVAERENLWDAQLASAKQLRDIAWVPGDFDATIRTAQALAASLWPFLNESVLKEVDTYTYRTEHVMLSTAQDYRKGLRGSQTHSWQATLDEHALVFTQHPGFLPLPAGTPVPETWDWQQSDEPGPGYWTGESSQPRAAQHENVTIAIYAPQYIPVPLLGFGYREETHAYFPRAHFDEVVQDGSWTFGRRGDGFVALYSWRPTVWRSGQPEVFQNGGLDFDLVAEGGARNVWIAEVGSLEDWPAGFEAFRTAVAAASVVVTPTAEAFDVAYQSPSRGLLEWGWEGPLVVAGEAVSIGHHPRMQNPFTHVEFLDRRYEVSDGAYRLILDFDVDLREAASMSQRAD